MAALTTGIASLSMGVLACTPPVDGLRQTQSPEDEATAVLKDSDSVYIGRLVSVHPASKEDGVLNRIAHFKVQRPLRGNSPPGGLYFHESTCGSAFVDGRPSDAKQLLVVLVKGDKLLRAFKEDSVQGRTVRLAFMSRTGHGPPASSPDRVK